MSAKPESLDDSAQLLGYRDEAEMLTELYQQGRTIDSLAEQFGYSRINMRSRLLRAGVLLRPKGGWHRKDPITKHKETTDDALRSHSTDKVTDQS